MKGPKLVNKLLRVLEGQPAPRGLCALYTALVMVTQNAHNCSYKDALQLMSEQVSSFDRTGAADAADKLRPQM